MIKLQIVNITGMMKADLDKTMLLPWSPDICRDFKAQQNQFSLGPELANRDMNRESTKKARLGSEMEERRTSYSFHN